MEITSLNLVPLLTNCVNELQMIVSQLKEMKQENINNYAELQNLNSRFIAASQYLADIIKYIGNNKPDPAPIGDKLKVSIQLVTAVLNEKTRILMNTPDAFIATNDISGFN